MVRKAQRSTTSRRTRFNARRHRTALWVVVTVTAFLGVLAMFARISLQAPGGRVATELVVTGLGMVTGLLILITAIFFYNGYRNRARDLVAALRPEATIIPAFAEGPHGLAGTVPTTIVLAVVEDRIEVWAGGPLPISAIALTGADIRVLGVRTGGRLYPGISVTNGVNSLSFVPHYSATVNPADLERALRELGEDPSEHMER
jgi:hypothetical protein